MYEDGALHLQTKSKKYGKLGALRINSAVNMSNHRDHFCGRVIEQAIGVCWVAAGFVNRVCLTSYRSVQASTGVG